MLRSIVLAVSLCAGLALADPPAEPAALAADAAPAPAPPAPVTPPAASSGQVHGTISYGRHDPAVGAIVVIRPEGGGSPVRLATTGISGTFSFDGLAEGDYRVEVHRDGYVPVVKSDIKVRGPFRAVVEVLLVAGKAPRVDPARVDGTASLTGTVRVAGGALLAEARVRLTRDDGADDARTILTDGAGSFSVPKLKAGRWRLDVQGAGWLPVRADLDFAGDVALDVNLAAQPANYTPLPQDLIVPEEVIPPAGI